MIENQTFLVDVTGLLIRYKKAIDADNGAIYGLARKLDELSAWEPQRIYGAIDYDGPLKRETLCETYKSWRSRSIDSVLHRKAKQLLNVFDGKMVQADGAEADDIIAWLCEYHDDELKIIVTGDSDLFGLIGEQTMVEMEAGNQHKRQGRWTIGRFTDQFGFPPSEYAKYRALKGDRSDGVPGLDNVGEVKAKELLGSDDDRLQSDRYRTYYSVLRLRPDDVHRPNFQPSTFSHVRNGEKRELYERWGFDSLL